MCDQVFLNFAKDNFPAEFFSQECFYSEFLILAGNCFSMLA